MSQERSKQIQWYPGHMFKSMREIREKLKLMDMVMILLDARLPRSSMNPDIVKTIKQKPAVILLNKMDLADDRETDRFINDFKKQGILALKIDAQNKRNIHQIEALAKLALKDQLDKQKEKGLKDRPIRTMILGIPNVGKSTLINALANKKATRTANRPGVTRAQQWIKLGDTFELLDTPGVLWPKFEDENIGMHLAITGAIKDHILPTDDIVCYALDFLKVHYPDRLKSRYDLLKDMSCIEMLDHIGRLRGALLKGADIDYDRVYQIILTDIRNGQLGGLTFDRL